jgi:hypothetical protein
MKVRRKSPICTAIRTDGTAEIRYKGKMIKIQADYEVILPDGSKAAFGDLSGFRIIQENPLLVQQIFPIEEAVQWTGQDHHAVRKHGEGHVMIDHAGNPNDISHGDHIVGEEFRRRVYQKDMIHYEVVE